MAVPPLYKVELSLSAVAAAKALSASPTSSSSPDALSEVHSERVFHDDAGWEVNAASKPPSTVPNGKRAAAAGTDPDPVLDLDLDPETPAPSSGKKAAAAGKPKAQLSDSVSASPRTLWCFSEDEMREAVKGLPSGSFTLQV